MPKATYINIAKLPANILNDFPLLFSFILSFIFKFFVPNNIKIKIISIKYTTCLILSNIGNVDIISSPYCKLEICSTDKTLLEYK